MKMTRSGVASPCAQAWPLSSAVSQAAADGGAHASIYVSPTKNISQWVGSIPGYVRNPPSNHCCVVVFPMTRLHVNAALGALPSIALSDASIALPEELPEPSEEPPASLFEPLLEPSPPSFPPPEIPPLLEPELDPELDPEPPEDEPLPPDDEEPLPPSLLALGALHAAAQASDANRSWASLVMVVQSARGGATSRSTRESER